jgi:excisionase family DNA binding protein
MTPDTNITIIDLTTDDAPATITVTQAGRLLGISRGGAYRAATAGELPTIRIGRRLLVPVPALMSLLGAGATTTVEVAQRG